MMSHKNVMKSILLGMLFLSPKINAWGITDEWPGKLKESCDNFFLDVNYLWPSKEYAEGIYVKLSWRIKGRFYDTTGVLFKEIDCDDIDTPNSRELEVYDRYNENGDPIKQYYFYDCREKSAQTSNEDFEKDFVFDPFI